MLLWLLLCFGKMVHECIDFSCLLWSELSNEAFGVNVLLKLIGAEFFG